ARPRDPAGERDAHVDPDSATLGSLEQPGAQRLGVEQRRRQPRALAVGEAQDEDALAGDEAALDERGARPRDHAREQDAWAGEELARARPVELAPRAPAEGGLAPPLELRS